MRVLATTVMTTSLCLIGGYVMAADHMTIAVFTKNLTNPAYEAFRIAADQVAHSTGGTNRALCAEAPR
jgi:ribose transport system substrate-binding protein